MNWDDRNNEFPAPDFRSFDAARNDRRPRAAPRSYPEAMNREHENSVPQRVEAMIARATADIRRAWDELVYLRQDPTTILAGQIAKLVEQKRPPIAGWGNMASRPLYRAAADGHNQLVYPSMYRKWR